MVIENITEIPRIFTAIAEIVACLLYLAPLKKRYHGVTLVILAAIWVVGIVVIHMLSNSISVIYWIPGMIAAISAMYLFILHIGSISLIKAGFILVRAFLLAEFAAAIEWQIYCYLVLGDMVHSNMVSPVIMVMTYIIVFTVAYFFDAKSIERQINIPIGIREFISAALIGLATFTINNVNFIANNPFSTDWVLGTNILYIRTLIDFSGLLMLIVWSEQRQQHHANYEIKIMNDILDRQYAQYQNSKENIEIINRKYHDMKHQINIIRAETDQEKRNSYINALDEELGVYASQYNTGNAVLDVILAGKSLYCKGNDIRFNCVADGSLLNFMHVMDICSIFGNALDNSIESAEKVADVNQRLIRVAIFSRNQFLSLRFENYFDHELVFQDGFPQTTKNNSGEHGYGIKSIRQTLEKYDGNLSVSAQNHWFIVTMLIPLPEKDSLVVDEERDRREPPT